MPAPLPDGGHTTIESERRTPIAGGAKKYGIDEFLIIKKMLTANNIKSIAYSAKTEHSLRMSGALFR